MGGSWLAVVAALFAVTLTGCTSLDPEPTEAPDTASSSAVPTESPTPERTQETTRAESGGARFDVPDEVILQQLLLAAERIAQNYTAPPTPTPVDIDPGTNRALGYQLLLDFGFAEEQWRYLDALWQRESGWNHLADNPTSSAYGIPQSLPGTKMAVVGPDWRTNPDTQIRWGLAYIAARYGTPEKAWAHSERVGWY
jgi:hypothetical protein